MIVCFCFVRGSESRLGSKTKGFQQCVSRLFIHGVLVFVQVTANEENRVLPGMLL